MCSIWTPSPTPNPFCGLLEIFIAFTSSSVHDTAIRIVLTVSTSLKPLDILWQFWDACFITAATITDEDATLVHARLIQLLIAIRSHPPIHPLAIGAFDHPSLKAFLTPGGQLDWNQMPCFVDVWKVTHTLLLANRDWDGIMEPAITTSPTPIRRGDECFLHFSRFSASWIFEAHYATRDPPPLTIEVFYAARDVLELVGPGATTSRQTHRRTVPFGTDHRITRTALWNLDVQCAAYWIRAGTWSLLHLSKQLHRMAPSEEDSVMSTTMWENHVPYLPKHRWELWGKQLLSLGVVDHVHWPLTSETKETCLKAAKNIVNVIKSL